jgi:hypothetical protein
MTRLGELLGLAKLNQKAEAGNAAKRNRKRKRAPLLMPAESARQEKREAIIQVLLYFVPWVCLWLVGWWTYNNTAPSKPTHSAIARTSETPAILQLPQR